MQTHTQTIHDNSYLQAAAHTSISAMAELELLDRCKAGESAAWNTLIHKYEKSVYKFAYSLCRNHEEAGDIAGQVFLRLYQNLHTFRNEASFTSWLFRIVRNTYLDLCVRPAHRSHLSLDAGPNGDPESAAGRDVMDSSPGPEAQCIDHEISQMLSKAIMNLPAYQRQVLRMYHTEGKSYEEIAETTGLSIGTVKSRLKSSPQHAAGEARADAGHAHGGVACRCSDSEPDHDRNQGPGSI